MNKNLAETLPKLKLSEIQDYIETNYIEKQQLREKVKGMHTFQHTFNPVNGSRLYVDKKDIKELLK